MKKYSFVLILIVSAFASITLRAAETSPLKSLTVTSQDNCKFISFESPFGYFVADKQWQFGWSIGGWQIHPVVSVFNIAAFLRLDVKDVLQFAGNKAKALCPAGQ